jgi:RNA polymerase sigma factor (sigma-70 family)
MIDQHVAIDRAAQRHNHRRHDQQHFGERIQPQISDLLTGESFAANEHYTRFRFELLKLRVALSGRQGANAIDFVDGFLGHFARIDGFTGCGCTAAAQHETARQDERGRGRHDARPLRLRSILPRLRPGHPIERRPRPRVRDRNTYAAAGFSRKCPSSKNRRGAALSVQNLGGAAPAAHRTVVRKKLILKDLRVRTLNGLSFFLAKRSNTSKLVCGESRSYSGAALKLNDRQAFVTETATKYGKRLRGYVAARVRNAADVSDLVQEVFLRLLRMDQHEPIRNFEAYLMTIAAHVLHQHQVRRAAAPESLEALLDSQMGSSPAPDAQVDAQRRLQALDRILERLSPNVYASFVMRQRDGMGLQEIADRLGVSRAMVIKYMNTAMQMCREQLKPGD